MSTQTPTQVTIRSSIPDDAAEIARLATIDSAPVPAGPFLLAEVNGQLHAALAIADGRVIADPFVRTSGLVALLRDRDRTPVRGHRPGLRR
ncbi:MAG TPA: hypothetical protein VHW26_11985, partial [Solirubrobacteraceae bacterium]|nr:hypothetical protein [Solirubrobacteraceae bacterium]